MAFDARDAVKALPEYAPYTFTGLDGETYELPAFETLTYRQVEQMETDPREVIASLNPAAFEALADLPVSVWQAFGEDWRDSAGEPGKSPSPSRATRRAQTRSKQT